MSSQSSDGPDEALASSGPNDAPPLIAIEGLTKTFGATRALRGVSFDIRRGETLGLLGANGAGKSTLIKALAGIHRPTSGVMRVDGRACDFRFPSDARDAGIATVHQNIDDGVVFGMTVAENLLLDEIATTGAPPFVTQRSILARARAVQQRLDLDLPLESPVENLSPSARQEVAIARELAKNPKLLILDEPTSTLSEREAEKLYEAVAEFRTRGIAILFISHSMSEVKRLCDRAVVLRDGRIVSTHGTPMDTEEIANSILGDLVLRVDHESRKGHGSAFQATALRAMPHGPEISFDIRRGEILGLTGLIGAGKSELLEQICGHRRIVSGKMAVEGADFRPRDVADAMEEGVVMVPEQRALQSIFPGEPLWKHCSIGLLSAFEAGGFMQRRREIAFTEDVIRDFRVVADGPRAVIESLSGGNQQKLLVGRWLSRGWKLLVLDEPFRGIDIGARGLICDALRAYSEEVPVLICSSDPEEVIEVADRVMIMVEGGIVHIAASNELSVENLASIMAGAVAAPTETKVEAVCE